MSKKGNQKKPSRKYFPSKKKMARGGKKAKKNDDAFCVWDTTCIDCGGKWSWNEIDPKVWWQYICPARENFQSMRWSEIIGNRHHSIEVSEIIPEAQRRLEEISQHDIDFLCSFALGNLPRIWGIRDRRLFKVLWWDPKHEICPVDKPNT